MRLSPEIAGDYLARSVVDSDGKVLLAAGSQLTSRYVERLLARGVVSVYLTEDAGAEVVSDEAQQSDARSEAVRLAREALGRASRPERRGLPAAACMQVLGEVMDTVWRNHGLSVDLSEIRRASPYTFAHSVHVAVTALLIGQAHGLRRSDLPVVTAGALLQDIGIVRYADLIRQPRPLTPEEFVELQRHTEDGYRYLRDEAGVDLLVAHVAYQHHERLDGSGYPRGLAGEDIHVFARIAAVADVYDALTADRPFKAGMPPHEAMGVLRGMAEDKLDAELVRHLSEQIAVYAAGTPVLLSSGELAVVMAPGGGGPSLPVVRIIADETLRVTLPREVDLGSDAARRSIRQVLPDNPRLLRRHVEER